MSSETETLALHLVRALYNATDGRPTQWRMLAGLDGVTADAIEFAVASASSICTEYSSGVGRLGNQPS